VRLLRGARAAYGGTRTARKEGRIIAVLTVGADGLTVAAQAFPRSDGQPVPAGPFQFATTGEASAFLDETIDALTYLGCEVE
jgi:hypothetical protein